MDTYFGDMKQKREIALKVLRQMVEALENGDEEVLDLTVAQERRYFGGCWECEYQFKTIKVKDNG